MKNKRDLKNHSGLFLNNGNLESIEFFGVDVLDRPQFKIYSTFLDSWDGHQLWDRTSALIFDYYGFLIPSDGALSLGQTYDDVPVEFIRHEADLSEFSFEPDDCIDFYFNVLRERGALELIQSEERLMDILINLKLADPNDRELLFNILIAKGFVSPI